MFDGYHYENKERGEEYHDGEDLCGLFESPSDCDQFIESLNSRFASPEDLYTYLEWNCVRYEEVWEEFCDEVDGDEVLSDEIAEVFGLEKVQDEEGEL